MLSLIGKYLTGKLAAKAAWLGFKVAAKYTDNKYDDAIVMFKQGLETGDMNKLEKGFELLGEEYKKYKMKK